MHEPRRPRGAHHQGDLGPRRDRPRRHRQGRRVDRRRLLRPHARPARPPRPVRPHRQDRGRPAHRLAPHHRGHRPRARRRLQAGARRQGGHLPLRQLHGPAGRVARPGHRRPVRPPLPGAHRAREHGADDRRVRHDDDPAHPGVLRRPGADRAARARARTGATRTTSWSASSRRWPGPCATPASATRAPPASSPPRRARCDHDRPLHRPDRRRALPASAGSTPSSSRRCPRASIVLLAIGAAMCLVAGVLRLEVWN